MYHTALPTIAKARDRFKLPNPTGNRYREAPLRSANMSLTGDALGW